MSAEQLDVVIEQGATFSQLWEIQNKDLTTYTFTAQFRTSHAATSTVFTLTNSGAATLIVQKVGSHTHVTADLGFAATAALTAPMQGVYDIEYTNAGGSVRTRAFEGSFYITPEATR